MSIPLSPSQSGPKFRVAICGAGIGGLVLAITIGKYDPSIPIDLYEARDSIDTAGVGITVWRQTHEVMIELGLFDDFKQIFTHSAEGSYIRRADIREGGYLWYRTARSCEFPRWQRYLLLEPFFMKRPKLDLPPCIVSTW
jgi:salicylate hydroxylase